MSRPSRLLPFLIGLPIVACSQVTIVSYTFEDTTVPAAGASLSPLTWNSGGSALYVSPVFASQGQAVSVGGFQSGEYFQITLNATGYRDITLQPFRTNASGGAAPAQWKISYSLAGSSGTFTDVTTYTLSTATGVLSTTVPALFLPEAANDNAFLVLRLTATSPARVDGGGSAANGTVRLDNITFTAAAIPEPSAYAALAGLAALAFHGWHRRRRPPGGFMPKRKGPPEKAGR